MGHLKKRKKQFENNVSCNIFKNFLMLKCGPYFHFHAGSLLLKGWTSLHDIDHDNVQKASVEIKLFFIEFSSFDFHMCNLRAFIRQMLNLSSLISHWDCYLLHVYIYIIIIVRILINGWLTSSANEWRIYYTSRQNVYYSRMYLNIFY